MHQSLKPISYLQVHKYILHNFKLFDVMFRRRETTTQTIKCLRRLHCTDNSKKLQNTRLKRNSTKKRGLAFGWSAISLVACHGNGNE